MQAILIRVLIWFASSLVARLLLGAGLALVSYSFINDLVAQAQNAVGSYIGGLPSDVLGLISLLKIPQAISVVLSAVGIAAFIKSSKLAIGKSS